MASTSRTEHAKGEHESVQEYQRATYNHGVNIPAEGTQNFEQAWGPNAPARCPGCKAPLPKERGDPKRRAEELAEK